jgi:hypothetical protein
MRPTNTLPRHEIGHQFFLRCAASGTNRTAMRQLTATADLRRQLSARCTHNHSVRKNPARSSRNITRGASGGTA